MKQYFSLGKREGTELRKTKTGLLLYLRGVRCSKFHNSSSRTRNLEVEDFLERWFSYLQVLFRSRSSLKAARALKRAKHKTVQIWVKTASTTSSRFERVSCVGIEPNELHAYTKNRGTLNKLTLEFWKNSPEFPLDSEGGKIYSIKRTLLLSSKINPSPFLLPPQYEQPNIQVPFHN